MKRIYLDNAATSFPKPETVYQAVMDTLRYGGSPGRGSHQQTMAADRQLFETRELLAEQFNAPNSDHFIFTANATMAINMALFGLLKPGDRVVTTSMEHNAVVRPLRALQDRGIEVYKVKSDPVSGILDSAAVKQACLAQPTRLLCISHCSNVTGSVQPIEQLGSWCQEQEILFMVDAAQSAGILPIDIQADGINLLAAPGHKGLLGPQGTGFLYFSEDLDLIPLIYGGTGTHSGSDRQPAQSPERYESGTHNVPGLVGLKAGLSFVKQTGLRQIRERDMYHAEMLMSGLTNIDRVKVYGPLDLERRCGALSFNIAECDPAEVGFLLDRDRQISVRVGLHCAPDAHRTIGSYPGGTVRVSPGWFTTDADIEFFIRAVEEITCTRQSS